MLTQQEMDEVKRITAFLKLPEDEQYGSILMPYLEMHEEERRKALAEEHKQRTSKVELCKKEAEGCRDDLLKDPEAKEELRQELEQNKWELSLISKGLSDEKLREQLLNDSDFVRQYQEKKESYQAGEDVYQKGTKHEEALKNYQISEEAMQKGQEECISAIEDYYKAETENDKRKALKRYAILQMKLMKLALEDYRCKDKVSDSFRRLKEAGQSIPEEE